MTHAAPAVALLFDDSELGGQLRDALHERGARIVHEGEVSSLSRELLQQVGADVLVVNLDDAADDALDQLYAVIEGDRPRVVFNDAQASRALAGWDRARWARHLAVKVLAAGDIDPPRPENAAAIEVAMAAPVHGDVAEDAADVTPAEAGEPAKSGLESAEVAVDESLPEFEADIPRHDPDEQHEQAASAESENLAAELEALLASGDLPVDEEESSGPGLRYSENETPPELHDGNFGVPAAVADSGTSHAREESASSMAGEGELQPSSVTPPVFDLDHLQLSPLDPDEATTAIVSPQPAAIESAASASVRAPDGWALFDDEAVLDVPTATAEQPDAAAFGISKMSAADYLAPDVEPVAQGFQPVMSLELVSMEEAIAPQAYERVSEMNLDAGTTALSRIVLLGATADGIDSVCEFLAEIPAASRLTFLHTQRAGAQPLAEQIEKLARHCRLPLRLAGHGERARAGEVLVVPDAAQVLLRRDGSIEIQTGDAEPSIDASFTMAANAFGRDALAIVFAGRANDAVAGAQAIHDRGGQVWVESSSGEHFADMVSGIFAERLVSYSGTPRELAAHLLEVFP